MGGGVRLEQGGHRRLEAFGISAVSPTMQTSLVKGYSTLQYSSSYYGPERQGLRIIVCIASV